MKYRVAVVEDDELICQMIRLNLEKSGFEVECFGSAESLKETIETRVYDLILLDILLPGMSGLQLLQTIRDLGINTPIMMLTVEQKVESKINALNTGADDYLVKPFNVEELLARVQRLILRSTGERVIPSAQILVINRHKINLSTHLSESALGEVALSEKEIKLLSYFALNAGKTLKREDILEEVWGMDVDPTPRTIDNFVAKFRKLYEDRPEKPKHFITVRNQGYRFER